MIPPTAARIQRLERIGGGVANVAIPIQGGGAQGVVHVTGFVIPPILPPIPPDQIMTLDPTQSFGGIAANAAVLVLEGLDHNDGPGPDFYQALAGFLAKTGVNPRAGSAETPNPSPASP